MTMLWKISWACILFWLGIVLAIFAIFPSCIISPEIPGQMSYMPMIMVIGFLGVITGHLINDILSFFYGSERFPRSVVTIEDREDIEISLRGKMVFTYPVFIIGMLAVAYMDLFSKTSCIPLFD